MKLESLWTLAECAKILSVLPALTTLDFKGRNRRMGEQKRKRKQPAFLLVQDKNFCCTGSQYLCFSCGPFHTVREYFQASRHQRYYTFFPLSAEQPKRSLMWTALNPEAHKLKVCACCIHMKKPNFIANRATSSAFLFTAVPLILEHRQKHHTCNDPSKKTKNNQTKKQQNLQLTWVYLSVCF